MNPISRKYSVVILDSNAKRASKLMEMVVSSRLDCHILAFNKPDSTMHSYDSTGGPDILIVEARGMWGSTSGIKLASLCAMYSERTQVIFIDGEPTATPEVYAVDHVFLLPANPTQQQVHAALILARQRILRIGEQPLILQMADGRMRNVQPHDISYVQSNRRMLTVHTDEGTAQFYGKLSDFLALLSDEFVQCHQSYAVNLSRIESMTDSMLTLFSGERLPVSRRKYRPTRDAFLAYMGRSLD